MIASSLVGFVSRWASSHSRSQPSGSCVESTAVLANDIEPPPNIRVLEYGPGTSMRSLHVGMVFNTEHRLSLFSSLVMGRQTKVFYSEQTSISGAYIIFRTIGWS